MIVINGKYTHINVMLSKEDGIDEETRKQLQTAADLEIFNGCYIAVMPDCHAGKGCTIGFTQKMNDYVIPNMVGVDLGCGILAIKLGKVEINRVDLDSFILDRIPLGHNHRKVVHPHAESIATSSELSQVCNETNQSINQVIHQLGTLGGGNHFIELGIDLTENKWLFVHSGSRNFGLKIANFYQKKAAERCKNYLVNIPKGCEFIHKMDNIHYYGYLNSMRFAQKFAALNRFCIAYDIIKFLGLPFEISEFTFIDTIHNYISTESDGSKILRKGAIDASEGKLCVIPINMREGVILAKGKGSNLYNNSAPHGAGRLMSRNEANKVVNADKLDDDMRSHGVYTTTAKYAKDEAPEAYKSKELILRNILPTVEVIDIIKSIYNLKSPSDESKE